MLKLQDGGKPLDEADESSPGQGGEGDDPSRGGDESAKKQRRDEGDAIEHSHLREANEARPWVEGSRERHETVLSRKIAGLAFCTLRR